MGAVIPFRVEMAPGSPRATRTGTLLVVVAVLLLWLPCLLFVGARVLLPGDGAQVVIDPARAGASSFVVQPLTITGSGLNPGDLVIGVEGRPVESWLRDIPSRHLLESATVPVDRLVYTVVREGQLQRVTVPLARFPFVHAIQAELTVFLFLLYFQTLGILVFCARPGQSDARLFVLVSSAIFVNGTIFNLGLQASDLLRPWIIGLWMCGTVIMIGVMLPVTLHFSLVFPRRQPLLDRHPWMLALVYAAIWLVYLAFLVPGWTSSPSAIARFYLLVRGTAAMHGSYLILIVASWTYSYFSTCNTGERRQLRWVLWGMAVGLVPFLMFSIVPSALGTAQPVNAYFEMIGLFLCAIPTTTMIAILRAGLFDIDRIIRRTLVYTLLTTVLLVIYVGSVVVFQYMVRRAVGQESDISVVASTLVVAAAFTPLRRRIQRGIDRRFFRAHYNAELALSAFSTAIRDCQHTDLEQLTEELVEVIDQTMHPTHVSLWLREAGHVGARSSN
jgi:hypothetical protein